MRSAPKFVENIGPSTATFPCPALVNALLINNTNKSPFPLIHAFLNCLGMSDWKQSAPGAGPGARQTAHFDIILMTSAAQLTRGEFISFHSSRQPFSHD